ncbi:MATE family efflux transporter [Lihuaxuella thermophila]|uniref:Multidrug resistance protein, MATE family n=1 Tax=Lihuaxuella thermophila TaxID=1173111 RepID=A0A1H8BKL7_9BACL|nr:MATE family efflux transporter [Lihuaxuella thermophila]SEM82427.1 multidrug resistance protein, MATE family [Lihuaxuella thermophila]
MKEATHRAYLLLAFPLLLSSLSSPLLGAVDTAVVGRLNDPSCIGGVAVATLIFNTCYWLFGFLRVSTSGFTAQASGAKDQREICLHLLRPLLVAGLMGMGLILFQSVILFLSLHYIQPDAEVAKYAKSYFDIRIWGAPFALMNYVLLGWFMGMAKVKLSLILQLYMNLVNIVLDLILVGVAGMNVDGVAWASLIAEISSCLIGFMLILRHWPGQADWKLLIRKCFLWKPFLKMFRMNRDLMIRTACLLAVFTLFTRQGAQFGQEILAANAILFQIHFLMAYCLDGLANASGILAGHALGRRDPLFFNQVIRLTRFWGWIVSLLLSGLYFLSAPSVFSLFTNHAAVLEAATEFSVWMVLFPVCSFWGLLLYGVFSGATEAGPIRNSMIWSLIAFLLSLWLFLPRWGNHGLWCAFLIFSLGRSLFLHLYLPKLHRSLFSHSAPKESIAV